MIVLPTLKIICFFLLAAFGERVINIIVLFYSCLMNNKDRMTQ